MRDLFGIFFSTSLGPIAIGVFNARELFGDEVFFSSTPMLIGDILTPGYRYARPDVASRLEIVLEDENQWRMLDPGASLHLPAFFQRVQDFPEISFSPEGEEIQRISDIDSILFIDHNIHSQQEYRVETLVLPVQNLFPECEDHVETVLAGMRASLQGASDALSVLESRCKAIGFIEAPVWATDHDEATGEAHLRVRGLTKGYAREAICESLEGFIQTWREDAGQKASYFQRQRDEATMITVRKQEES